MQLVNDRWYIWYGRIAAIAAGLLLVASVISWVLPQYQPLGKEWGLNYITFAAAAATVLYKVLIYKKQAENIGHQQAMLILSSIQSVTAMSLLHSSGQMESPYLVLWGIITFLAGMFGAYAIAGVCFLLSMYYIVVTTDRMGNTEFSIIGTIGFACILAIGVASYFFWKERYINADSAVVKKLSGQLKSKQMQAEMLLQSITDAIIMINNEGKIGMMNQAAASMTEWPIDEGTGLDINVVAKLAHEDGKELESTENPFQKALQNETQASSQILRLVGRNGKIQTVSVSLSPIFIEKGVLAGVVAAIRDVSANREEEKRRADFISTASHEMRTPVAAIEGYLALALNEHVSKIDTKAREYLEKAHASTQHLGKLFQDLLTSAKAEDGRLVSHPIVVEMGAYLDGLVESLRFAAEKKGLLMDFTIGASDQPNGLAVNNKVVKPLYYVMVDPDRLREVITNLTDNAIKYTPNGRISVGLTGNDSVVQFYVRDTGPGIAPEDITHLFQKFYRVDNSSTRTVGGTGLGLFICRKIIEMYKGRIWAESVVGKGSTFYMNLPRLTSQKALELQRTEAQQQTSSPVTSLSTPVI